MYDILHRVTIETSPEALYKALTEEAGLSAWWTRAQTIPEVGHTARFAFGPNGEHVIVMQIVRLEPNAMVVWKCIEGPWVETGEFSFTIAPDERGAILSFAHRDWLQADEFYQHCNCKWGYFLGMSLKLLLETGQGMPHPEDPAI